MVEKLLYRQKAFTEKEVKLRINSCSTKNHGRLGIRILFPCLYLDASYAIL